MNGRTAQNRRIPVNGTAAASGTNGHAPRPETRIGPAPADAPAAAEAAAQGDVDNAGQPNKPEPGAADRTWQGGRQVAEIRLEQAHNGAAQPHNGAAQNGAAQNGAAQTPPSEWIAQVRDRPRIQGGTTLGQFNTPVRVDEIAVAAMTLAEDLHAATQSMPESVELRRFRHELDQAATTFRELASKLEVTAGNLVRLAANEGHACGVGWGVCPEHGLTLMNIGEAATCHVLGCGRQNVGAVERCEHPVAYRVVDAAGPALLTCAGHAIACRLYLDSPVITAASDSMELF